MAIIEINTDDIAGRFAASVKQALDFDRLPHEVQDNINKTIIEPGLRQVDTFDVDVQAEHLTQSIVDGMLSTVSTQIQMINIFGQYMKVEED